MTIATTRIIAMHQNKGKTIAQCLAERTDYAKNSEKTNNEELISAYECDPHTADAEFLFSKRQYSTITGREQKRDVIAYQIRQFLSRERSHRRKQTGSVTNLPSGF